MEIIDLHCDALYKLWKADGGLNFIDSPELDVNLKRMKEGDVKIQCFAVYVPPEINSDQQFHVALKQIDHFEKIIKENKEMVPVRRWEDFANLQPGEVGAMLSLEGVDCIGNNLKKLAVLYERGVMSVGLTWNFANLAADGAMEPRGAGVSLFGKEVVLLNNRHSVLTDVSHLSEQAFWDVMELADFPVASHSNSKTICNHPRNLTDLQAKALFLKRAPIHIVYYPPFVKEDGKATIHDLIKHIDHFCSLGGIRHIGIGSDFDGISQQIPFLEHAGMHQNLVEELLKYYSDEQVKGFTGGNFLNCLPAR